ncbi:MAG TPA: type II secretion system F family protein [Candidatus Dormibacteraeota bacterium]|nr:type II secretion system F family protein [Candidatus Dormibacteraeota bacterium]
MPVFTYRGTNRAGATVTGEQMAPSKTDLANALRRQQINVTKMSEKGKEFNLPTFGGGVDSKELAVFTRQFSVMIDAGLPLVQCLEILAGQQENKVFQKVLTGTRAAVEGGSTLSASMRPYDKVFDTLYVNLVEAGEAGGILDTILQRLSSYIEKNVKLKRAVKSALVYPIAVLSVAAAVIVLLLWKVVPIFATLFVGLGVNLPLPTRIVIAMSNFVGSIFGLMIFIFCVAAGIGVKVWYGTPAGRMAIDRVLLRLPLLGLLLRKIAVARFTRTLGTLISSGVPILEGLDITARTAGNAVIEKALLQVRKGLESGRNLSDPLRETDVFPGMVTQMIGVGEQTGAMDAMLQKIADFYEDEVDAAVKDLLSALEPMIIVILGVVVGGIVISMYLPLFSLIGQLSSAH